MKVPESVDRELDFEVAKPKAGWYASLEALASANRWSDEEPGVRDTHRPHEQRGDERLPLREDPQPHWMPQARIGATQPRPPRSAEDAPRRHEGLFGHRNEDDPSPAGGSDNTEDKSATRETGSRKTRLATLFRPKM